MYVDNGKISARQTFRLYVFDLMGIATLLLPPYLARLCGCDGIWAILIGSGLGLGYLVYLGWILKRMGQDIVSYLFENRSIWVCRLVFLLVGIHALWTGAFCACVFTRLMMHSLIQEASFGTVLLVLVITATYAVNGGLESRARVYEVLFWFVLIPYVAMMLVGAVFVLLYTLLGGFLAESASDFMQGIVMIIALAVIVIISVVHAGGIDAVAANAQKIPGFTEFFGIATPELVDDVQVVNADGLPVFGARAEYGLLNVFSMLAWGLGYFGMPQVLLRFMAIRKESELKSSRRIAMIWVVISLAVAVFIGIIGRQLFPTTHLTKSGAENIFITLATSFLPPILAGLVMAGILAATISSSDSYLLIAASAFAKNIFQGVCKKDATDKQVMTISRVTLLVIAAIAMVIALDENSVIFEVVSFAWSGFGATFGPLMLFSLFWKRTNRAGAIAGMVGGAGMVFLWKLVISQLGGAFGIYELLPAFIFSSILIVVVSLLTKAPSKEIEEDFDAVATGTSQD